MAMNGSGYYNRTVSNIPARRAAERIALLIERGEDPAVAAHTVLG
jgi:hypothetical protein